MCNNLPHFPVTTMTNKSVNVILKYLRNVLYCLMSFYLLFLPSLSCKLVITVIVINVYYTRVLKRKTKFEQNIKILQMQATRKNIWTVLAFVCVFHNIQGIVLIIFNRVDM